MASAIKRPILVVAGVGNGTGTGAATARLFAKEGYRVALIARNAEHLKNTADEINAAGGEAHPFPIPAYDYSSIGQAFESIRAHWPSETSAIRAALFNTAHGVWKPFLNITPAEVEEALSTNVLAAFAFSRAAILAFKENELDEKGKRGTLLFTGATASIRGNTTTSAFAAGKHGVRALSQSLAKEFGKENIHVAHAIIDGGTYSPVSSIWDSELTFLLIGIITDRSRSYRNDPEWEKNADVRLSPESIANSYLYLVNQDRSAWTWELDLRPAHEKW